MSHLQGCPNGGNAAFKQITQTTPSFMDKTNLFGKRSAKPTIQLDAETEKDDTNIDENTPKIEGDECIGLVGPLTCLCGETLFEDGEVVSPLNIRRSTGHYVNDCPVFLERQQMALKLQLDQNPDLIGMRVVEPFVTAPHKSKKAFVYGHQMLNTEVSFDWTFPEMFSYFGYTGEYERESTLLRRYRLHCKAKTINENTERMFGLVECDDDKTALELESVFIAFYRPKKNLTVGFIRLLQMTLEQFIEYCRVATLALRTRFDYLAQIADNNGTLKQNQLELYEKEKKKLAVKFGGLVSDQSEAELKSSEPLKKKPKYGY